MKIDQIGEDDMVPSFAKRLSFGNIDKGIVGITRTEIEMGK